MRYISEIIDLSDPQNPKLKPAFHPNDILICLDNYNKPNLSESELVKVEYLTQAICNFPQVEARDLITFLEKANIIKATNPHKPKLNIIAEMLLAQILQSSIAEDDYIRTLDSLSNFENLRDDFKKFLKVRTSVNKKFFYGTFPVVDPAIAFVSEFVYARWVRSISNPNVELHAKALRGEHEFLTFESEKLIELLESAKQTFTEEQREQLKEELEKFLKRVSDPQNLYPTIAVIKKINEVQTYFNQLQKKVGKPKQDFYIDTTLDECMTSIANRILSTTTNLTLLNAAARRMTHFAEQQHRLQKTFDQKMLKHLKIPELIARIQINFLHEGFKTPPKQKIEPDKLRSQIEQTKSARSI